MCSTKAFEGFEETVSALAERGIRTIGTVAGGLVRQRRGGRADDRVAGFHAMAQRERARDFAGRVTMLGRHRAAGGNVGRESICSAPCRIGISSSGISRKLATRALARKLPDEGAGLIVGGHAHVVQPVEEDRRTLVAYGLGDFLGTALPRTPWPLRIGAMLSVEISTDEGTRGEIAAYRVVPFLRERQGRHERLVSLEAAEGPIAEKARQRIAACFGDRSGGQGRKNRYRHRARSMTEGCDGRKGFHA